jgi:ubiquinone/menaquinone biosynthesis C-methylase UbiE
MKFYKDLISDLDKTTKTCKYQYHEWSPQSIEVFWDISTHNPFIRQQFYPMDYWEDLLGWAAEKSKARPSSIVDVGCGNGNLIECIKSIYRNATIYGVDLSEDSLEFARNRFRNLKEVRFKVGTLDCLPFEDNSIDLLTCTEVLEHTFPKTFENSFAEVSRILKKGGFYIASIPLEEKITFVCCPECGSVFTPYQHMMFEISRDEVASLLRKNGLSLVSFYESLDRSQPKNPIKKSLKPFIIKRLPRLASRLFPKAGVSGFLANKLV